jgi:hypothetical protein
MKISIWPAIVGFVKKENGLRYLKLKKSVRRKKSERRILNPIEKS